MLDNKCELQKLMEQRADRARRKQDEQERAARRSSFELRMEQLANRMKDFEVDGNPTTMATHNANNNQRTHSLNRRDFNNQSHHRADHSGSSSGTPSPELDLCGSGGEQSSLSPNHSPTRLPLTDHHHGGIDPTAKIPEFLRVRAKIKSSAPQTGGGDSEVSYAGSPEGPLNGSRSRPGIDKCDCLTSGSASRCAM